MALETVALDHVPASYSVHIAFFRDVGNASFLHQQLLARNGEFEYAFIDASIVSSMPHPNPQTSVIPPKFQESIKLNCGVCTL